VTVSSLPIWAVDLVGSALMILLSFLCLALVEELRRRDPNNVIWTYLFWVCIGLAGFAVSRSAGHILKQILLIGNHARIWDAIRPFSGAINTISFIFVASVTLFFERVWTIYQQILKDKQALQSARDELLYLNQNLENVVAERTRALALSEQNYRRIFEVSRDMIVVTDRAGTILNFNPAVYQILGYGGQEDRIVGASFAAFFDSHSDWEALIAAIASKGYVSNAEISLKHRHSRRIRTLVSGSLDQGLSTGEETIHFLVKDIEQRRMHEDQIAQADKLASIGQLSAGIAHEINNPLGIILGYTQLLIRNEDESSEKFQDLKTIEKHARNCKTIVEDLLNFSRTSKPHQDRIRVDRILDEVLSFISQHGDLENIEIQRNYDPQLPEMRLDEKKIKQVFINLIMNARHAMGDNHGKLTLSTELDAETHNAVIRIGDTGHGIEPKNLARIFDPFFTTKPTGEGTGLGLSVSYGIIKNHQGDIAVDSTVGSGTLFTITLPMDEIDRRQPHATLHSDRG